MLLCDRCDYDSADSFSMSFSQCLLLLRTSREKNKNLPLFDGHRARRSIEQTKPDRVMLSIAVVSTIVTGSVPLVKLNNGVEMPAIALGVWRLNETVTEANIKLGLKLGVCPSLRAALCSL